MKICFEKKQYKILNDFCKTDDYLLALMKRYAWKKGKKKIHKHFALALFDHKYISL